MENKIHSDEEKREAKKSKELDRIRAARELLRNTAVRNALAMEPHPSDPKYGTLVDYADWMIERAAHSGKVRIAQMVEKTARALPPRLLESAKIIDASPRKEPEMVSEHFGAVGQPETFDAEITDIFSTRPGWKAGSVAVKMLTSEGNVAVWFTSATLTGMTEGSRHRITATIKKHDVHKGINQTIVTGVAIER